MRPIGTSRRKLRASLLAAVTCTSVIVGLVVQSGPAAADVDAVSSNATALSVGGTPTATVQGQASEGAGTDGYGPIGSGFLPSGIACPSGSVSPVSLPVLLSLGLLDACVRGGGVTGENHLGFAEASAAVANVVIAGGPLGVVRSACRADGNGAVGSTEIIGSGIPGVPQNPAPNTVVGVPGLLPLGQILTLTLNEQIVNNVPGTATITVNAVRVTLLGINIILAQSSCAASGPNVNVTTTTTTTLPTTTGPTVTTTTTTTVPTTTGPTVTSPPTTGGGGGGTGNNNTNNNVNNNNNSVTVGGDTINVNTPGSFSFLPGGGQSQNQSQSQNQQQGQALHVASTGGVLARTGSTVAPMLLIAAIALLLGNMLRIGSQGVATDGPSELANRFPTVAGAPLEWGPAQIGKAMLAALAALIGAASRLFHRGR